MRNREAASWRPSAARYSAQHGITNPGHQSVRLTDEQLNRVRGRLRALVARWEQLPPGETLGLPFEVD